MISGELFNNNPNIHNVLLSGGGNILGKVYSSEATGSDLTGIGTSPRDVVGSLLSKDNARYGTLNNASLVGGGGILAGNTLGNYNLRVRSTTLLESGAVGNWQGPNVA